MEFGEGGKPELWSTPQEMAGRHQPDPRLSSQAIFLLSRLFQIVSRWVCLLPAHYSALRMTHLRMDPVGGRMAYQGRGNWNLEGAMRCHRRRWARSPVIMESCPSIISSCQCSRLWSTPSHMLLGALSWLPQTGLTAEGQESPGMSACWG